MAKNINIFGTKFAYPRGLRKSPGTHKMHGCIASKLYGKTGGGRGAQQQRFREAVAQCK